VQSQDKKAELAGSGSEAKSGLQPGLESPLDSGVASRSNSSVSA